MKLNRSSRGYRSVAGFILPPFFGAVMLLAITMAEELSAWFLQFGNIASIFIYFQNADIASIFIFIPFVYMVAMFWVGIQSLIYSLTMEFIVRPRLLRRKSFLVAGGFLGFLSALPLATTFPPIAIVVGVVVGVVVALLIYHKEH